MHAWDMQKLLSVFHFMNQVHSLLSYLITTLSSIELCHIFKVISHFSKVLIYIYILETGQIKTCMNMHSYNYQVYFLTCTSVEYMTPQNVSRKTTSIFNDM